MSEYLHLTSPAKKVDKQCVEQGRVILCRLHDRAFSTKSLFGGPAK